MADGEKRIIELEELTTLTDNDYIAVDNSASGGKTKKFKPKRLSDAITDLAETTEETIDGVIEETDSKFDEALALGTASGSIATFTDGSTLPMKKLEVDIEPVQDLHGYDSPWVGGSTRNKLPSPTNETKTSNGITIKNENGAYTLSGTATANTTISFSMDSVNLNPSANKIAFNNNVAINSVEVGFLRGSTMVHYWGMTSANRIASNWTDLGNENVDAIRFSISNGTTVNMTISPILIALNEENTSFIPYSNICPISGWDECKVSKYKAYQICETTSESVTNNGVTMSYLGNGKYRVKGSLATNSSATLALSIKPFTIYDGGDSYISFSNTYASAYLTQRFLKGNSVLDTWGLTTVNRTSSYSGLRGKETDKFDLVVNSALYGTELDFTFRIVFYSNTEKETYTIDLDGTRYGGTLDVVSGVLTVDREIVTYDGSETWQMSSGTGYYQFNKNQTDALNSVNAICDKFEKIATTERSQKSGLVSYASDKLMRFSLITDFGISTVEQWKTWLASNNVQVVYELATPQVIQLTPTEVKSLLATNNVFADTGDILDATYVRNANITINDLIRRIEALES